MWERYCLGVTSIIWVLDSADPSTFPIARNELASLLEKKGLKGIPLLVRIFSLAYFSNPECEADQVKGRERVGIGKQE